MNQHSKSTLIQSLFNVVCLLGCEQKYFYIIVVKLDNKINKCIVLKYSKIFKYLLFLTISTARLWLTTLFMPIAKPYCFIVILCFYSNVMIHTKFIFIITTKSYKIITILVLLLLIIECMLHIFNKITRTPYVSSLISKYCIGFIITILKNFAKRISNNNVR